MLLQTNIPFVKEPYNPINYNSNVCLLGSCFSEHIGAKLAYYKFKTFQNPFGILFHPKAIENVILKAINEETYTEEDIFYLNERWHCFEAHSEISDANKEKILEKLNSSIQQTHKQLQEASHVIITLGTAWAYRYIKTDTIVANCHKVPQKQFLKEILSVDEIAASVENCIMLLKSINPKITILFTVSPVRHKKDGFVENQRSKAHLLAGIHQHISARHLVHYFPSYELMMDELRDYRFYADDMLHPNTLAVNYIWEKFQYAWISHESEQAMEAVANIQKGLAHKPFNLDSEQHQKFKENLQIKIQKLQQDFPNIQF
ncbi:GSCFA domain-containing protein [Kordia sp.]|uniref:GSCFA domain-containing protein n=1 Tax=Kordia sp. TaxID=1965332 RepID=UPI0025BFFB4F|nr:GSCFA domain-containing protein [Kordia sp.]MCH2195194.1 GSCFA domain-containing protein [Kordia sp.]